MKKILFLSVISLLLFSADSFAAKRYWVATNAQNWNQLAQKWSATSGGAAGATVPGVGDTAYFDGNGTGNCIINAAVNVKRFDVAAGYSGTITQGANAITIGTGSGVFSGGTFTGGSSAITCNGSFTISGTAFTSTSNTLTVVGNYSLNSGSFTHNNGTTLFTTTNTIAGTIGFYNLTFTPAATAVHTISNTITANNTLALSGSNTLTLNTGTIDAKSAITITNSGTGGGGTATIAITGTASPTLTGSGTIGQGALPKLTINKSSGTLTLSSIISVQNDWTWTAGTLTTTGSTVAFVDTLAITGNHTLNNVTFQPATGTSAVYTIGSSTTLTVNGTLTTGGNGVLKFNTSGSGTIDAKGAVTLSNSGTGGGGTALITMTGGGTVNLTGNSTVGQSALPKFTINRAGTGGAVSMSSTISVQNDWTWTSGTVTYGSSTVAFVDTLTITGNHGLNNVTFQSTADAIYTIGSSTTLTVNGTLTTAGSGKLTFNTSGSGVIDTKSTISLNNSGTGGGGTATVKLSGTANLTMTGNSTVGNSALPKVTINKTGGTLTLASTISVANDWTRTAGDATPGSSTVAFIGGLTITGTDTLNHVTFTCTSSSTCTITNSVTVNGNLVTDGSGSLTLNTGTIFATGAAITINNTGTAGGGSATISITGTTNPVTFIGNSTVGNGSLPKVTINKSSGTLSLVNTISVANNWTWMAGTISYGTSTVAFVKSLKIRGTHGLYNVVFKANTTMNDTIGNAYTLTVNGTLTTDGTAKLRLDSGTIDTKGYIIINNSGTSGGGNATITVTGTGIVEFDSNVASNKGLLPNVTINKSGGSVTLKDTISVSGNWNCSLASNAYLTEGTSTLYLVNSKTLTGDHQLNNVFLDGGTYTMTTADTMRVTGLLKYVGTTSVIINTGTIIPQGNITLTNTATGGGGTGLLFVTGTGTQEWLGVAGVSNHSRMPNVRIKKTGGSVTLKNFIIVVGHWTYNSGTVTAHSSSTIGFATTKTITGTLTLNKVVFSGSAATFTIATGTVLTVADTLTVAGANALLINGDTIQALGHVIYSNSNSGTEGTATIKFFGTNSQELTGSGTAGSGSLPHVVINKTSGTLTLKSIITCAGHWTYIRGPVNANNNNSTVAFEGTFNLDGQGVSATMSFCNVNIYANTRSLTGTLDVDSSFTITGGAVMTAASHTIYVGGSWTNSGTFNADASTVVFNGSAHKTIARPGATETFYNLTFNRPYAAGNAKKSVKLNSRVDVTNALTMTRGRVKTTSSFYLRLTDNATCTGGSDTAYVDGPMRKLGNDAFTFPLGDTVFADTASYHPLTITAPSSGTDEFEAEYYGVVQGVGDSLVDSLASISEDEYWRLDRNVGSSTIYTTLGWNKNSDYPQDYNTLRIGNWNNVKWLDLGGTGVTVSGRTGTVTAVVAPTYVSNSALLTLTSQVTAQSYAVLHRKLDGGYYLVKNGALYFMYDEEYNDTNDELEFTIYDEQRRTVASSEGTYAIAEPSEYGDNRFYINLFDCSTNVNGSLGSGTFILEVRNGKDERWFLRFKHVTTITPNCPGVGGGGE